MYYKKDALGLFALTNEVFCGSAIIYTINLQVLCSIFKLYKNMSTELT